MKLVAWSSFRYWDYVPVRVGFLPYGRQKVAETSFVPAEMIILKMGAIRIEHGAGTGSAIGVLNV